MMSFQSGAGLLALVFLASCQSVSPRHSGSVFRNPADHIGQQVRVCGNLSGTANLAENREATHVLGIWTAAGDGIAVRLVGIGEYGRVCLTGTIRYIGCATDAEIICTDWATDYAIEVRRID